MNLSVKKLILEFLVNGPKSGGQIEDYIRSQAGNKASNASRRCRELENEGKIEAEYVHVEGVGNKVVKYRLKDEIKKYRPEIQERMEKERTLQTLFQL